ncbi:HAD family hydrolase [Cupriavidus agavae]|uniref:Putative hydrolase of the HAD superfamily n=1 Tax=Cupriavidus agavae TaxID=1001822 RepID=A0A4V2FHA6_9BURK|nr:HAD family hydrolase [Cupriavidus agavae]RZT39609.1 putative hydrolase of the HAD superfamily [Cupriavidus agavae]
MSPFASIAAISLDLDDTLWPFGPAVLRAEQILHDWLLDQAPRTSAVLTSPQVLRTLRAEFESARPELSHDLRGLRVGSIRMLLERSGEDPALAEAAYDVFFAARQRVDFFEDAFPALEWLSARFPLVALSNGTASLTVTGGHHFFRAALNPESTGFAKPEEAMFRAAAEAAGCRPGQMLHVGDDADLDVVGALAAGCHAAWLVRGAAAEGAVWTRGGRAPHLVIRDLYALCRAIDPACPVARAMPAAVLV